MDIIVALLVICLLVQFLYWHFIFRLAVDDLQSNKSCGTELSFLSVVICFHKTWDQFPLILHCLDQQTYRNFEVVLVNDGPVPLDQGILQNNIFKRNNIRHFEHPKSVPGKKDALSAGILEAQSDWVVLTDIDCQPGPEWLYTLAGYLPIHPSILLGYSPYDKKPGFLNFIIRQETLLTAFQYLGWARAGHPYMGVGRNMAYHKSIFTQITFDSHLHIPTGDDDLFVNEAAGKYPVIVCDDPTSFVNSQPPVSWQAWYRQKIRHKSGGKYYTFSSKFRLTIFILALMAEKILLLLLLFLRFDLFLIFTVLKVAVTIGPMRKLYSRFDQKSDFWKMWIYEWFHVLYLILVTPYIFFITKNRWD